MFVRNKATAIFLVLVIGGLLPARMAIGGPLSKSFKGAGELAAYGSVLVDGEPAESGTSIFSNSTITTPGSATAVVSGDQKFRVEVLSGTTAKFSFIANSMSCELIAGAVRVSSLKGNSFQIRTAFGQITGDGGDQVLISAAVSDGGATYSRYSGAVHVQGATSLTEVPKQVYFRQGVDTLSLGRAQVSPGSGSKPMSESATIFFVGVGSLVAAFYGLGFGRDASFFRVGGFSSPAAPKS